MSRLAPLLLLLLALPALSGCQRAYDRAYFSALERFGTEKREILVDRVGDARASQEEAKEQFRDALEEFSALVGFEGGELEATYERLQAEYERSEERAADVRDRIDAVDRVADALFAEWEAELDEYERADLRRESERQLRQARSRYADLLAAMERAEAKMAPVLEAFQDQVLYLKHNLNAQAVASLEGTVVELETDVAALVRDMERAIAEADAFIAQMQG